MRTTPHMDAVVQYIHSAANQPPPDSVVEQARKCLLDYVGVSLGAVDLPEARTLAHVAAAWGSQGKAGLFTGGTAAPAVAALVNGSLSHILDFDDTHIPSILHGSGPLWAALLAVGRQREISESRLLAAFAIGFQVGACIGSGNIGVRLTQSGWHATPILGRFGATAALAVALGLDELQTAHALGLSGVQTSGMGNSFGTMAKPLHVGQAAMGSVMSVELAEHGFEGPVSIFDSASGCLQTLLQDPALKLDLSGLQIGKHWELLNNSFKPYAACQLIHASLDAARQAYAKNKNRTGVWAEANTERIRAHVHPLAARIADIKHPLTPTEGRFSLSYCIALGLEGYTGSEQDFSLERLSNERLLTLASRIEIVVDENTTRTAARLVLDKTNGQSEIFSVTHAFGSADNPMQWIDLEAKFLGLATPVIGGHAPALLRTLKNFETPGSMQTLFSAIEGSNQ